MPWSKRRTEELGPNQDHDPTVVAVMGHGESAIASLFIFIRRTAEDAPFAAWKACSKAEKKRVLQQP